MRYTIEQLKESFKKTYGIYPTDEQLKVFIEYLRLIGVL